MGSAHSPTDPRSAIDVVNRAFIDAFSRRDAAAIAALYTADGQLLPPGNNIVSGRAAIAGYWGQAMKIGARKLETTELEIYREVAHEVGRYTVEAPDGSEADAGIYIVIWKPEDGVWRMHRDIWNSRRTAG